MTMRQRLKHLSGIFLLLLLSGCTNLFGARGLPADPLFAHRKPIETKAVGAPAQPMANPEPTPPINPYVADPRITSAK